jgi:hypothetical protein
MDACTYKQTKITSASCETSGKAKLTCTDCGMIRYKPILPLGHKKVVFQKQIKASFSKHGKLKGVHCSRCKKIFEHSFDIPKVPAPSLAYKQIVYNGKVKKPAVTIDSFQGHRYTEGQQYTVKYAAGRKKVGRYAVTVTLKGDYLAGSKTLYFTIVPKKPASASAKLGTGSGGYDDVHFSWSKSTGATGYLVYYKKASAKKYTFYKATTKTSVIKKNLADKTKYTFKVNPYYKTKTGKTKYYSTAQYKTRTITTKTN